MHAPRMSRCLSPVIVLAAVTLAITSLPAGSPAQPVSTSQTGSTAQAGSSQQAGASEQAASTAQTSSVPRPGSSAPAGSSQQAGASRQTASTAQTSSVPQPGTIAQAASAPQTGDAKSAPSAKVTHSSSTVLEAEAFGVGSVVCSRYGMELFPEQGKTKAVVYAETVVQLKEAIAYQCRRKNQVCNMAEEARKKLELAGRVIDGLFAGCTGKMALMRSAG